MYSWLAHFKMAANLPNNIMKRSIKSRYACTKYSILQPLNMAKILFDIDSEQQPADWSDCHLVMEISPHIFSYAIMNGDKKLLKMRFYEMDARENHELAFELGGIINTDEILNDVVEKKTFIYNFPESQLVPEKLFHADTGKELIELFHGDLNTGITLCEKIKESDQYNVYQVPVAVHNLLLQKFSNSRYWHYYSLWTGAQQKKTSEPASCISVLFYPNRILVRVVKNGQLHLLQSYIYEAAEDVGYYLLNICQQLQLAPEETPIVLSGMIEISSFMYTEIHKYFGQLSLENMPVASSIPSLEEYPAHFFSPLLKIALCVS
jgi:Protein of unknown function (DUF3822)